MQSINFLLSKQLLIGLALLSMLGFWWFGYELDRANFYSLIGIYAGLFILFYITVTLGKTHFVLLAIIALILRLIFLPVIPNLSQDFYRFIWDGRLLSNGLNPYLIKPIDFLQSGNLALIPQARELYEGMGSLSASHYTNYPPLNQFVFFMAALFSKNSIVGAVITLRTFMILTDVGILIYGVKLLKKLNLPSYHIFWYLLNPFIIIETTGNLHFESMMLFFLVLSLYLLACKKWIWSAVTLALSISVKLFPLLLLPLFLKYFLNSKPIEITNLKNLSDRFRESVKHFPKLIYFYLIILGVVALTFLPFLNAEFFQNYAASIGLWFKKFEFNASIYYILRYIGYQNVGYNMIGTLGPLLSKVSVLAILSIALFSNTQKMKGLITSMIFATFFYFLLSTTVHPWYVATPLILCVFTRYRFPLVWSLVVMLSYSAYRADGFQENLWLVGLEYTIVIGVFVWEVFWKKKEVKESPSYV